MTKVISRDGTPIAYERRGEGPPLILVGGAFSTGGAEAPLAALLAPRFGVVTYDRRGRGDSGDTPPYAVAREAEDLAALVEEERGPVSVYGMSSGGALVLEAAASGVPFDRIAVYEPPFTVVEPSDRIAKARYTTRLGELLAAGDRGGAAELFLSVVGMEPEVVAQVREAPMWPELEAVAPTLAYDDAVMGDGTVPAERLASVRPPVLVVDGGASPHAMREAARRVAGAVRRGRHRTLTGQVHDVSPHVLAPVLREFFAA
ncbi:alpha/beta hydrolase [Streptomyces sp. ISL-96]|uniref:alpha/beta fold hydrolase n=1 Tax=Streptomyces sp. ISL-96 TaxID=2819191 RepID=UPI001BEBCA31|nr:alpha/beta hydrolase [Streptomyces sp. ISL-96]MBT2487594.1 alpha/beta hydrolase [Streptomyces sp. ISL-96]